MTYNPKNLRIRRFEVQVHYDAAYLFWNLRGIIAEKWGHGPVFGGYGEAPDRVNLGVGLNENPEVVGVYGLKFVAWNWERMATMDEGRSLALDWVSDCLEVLDPQVVKKVFVRVMYAYPLTPTTKAKVENQLRNEFEGLELFNPQAYTDVLHGAQFSARKEVGGVNVIANGVFGIYSPQQAEEMCTSKQDIDKEWSLGLFFDRTETRDGGFDDPMATVEAAIETAFAEAREVVQDRLVSVVGNA